MKRCSLSFVRRLGVLALVAGVLASCASPAPVRPTPRFAYKQYPPITLNVASIQVQEQYVSPMRAPNAEHVMPLPLPQAVSEWARLRFNTRGTTGVLTITIRDASLVAKDLPRTQGVKGWFTVDQAERYEGKIAIEFKIDGVPGTDHATGIASVSRAQTMPENATINDRDVTWNRMEENMILDLDAGTLRMLQEKMPFLIQQ